VRGLVIVMLMGHRGTIIQEGGMQGGGEKEIAINVEGGRWCNTPVHHSTKASSKRVQEKMRIRENSEERKTKRGIGCGMNGMRNEEGTWLGDLFKTCGEAGLITAWTQ